MPDELDAILARMKRLERQLYVFKILAVVLAIVALVTALTPQPAAQPAGTARARQPVIEDQNRAWLSFSDSSQTPALVRPQ